jgi:hypothetical protein
MLSRQIILATFKMIQLLKRFIDLFGNLASRNTFFISQHSNAVTDQWIDEVVFAHTF